MAWRLNLQGRIINGGCSGAVPGGRSGMRPTYGDTRRTTLVFMASWAALAGPGVGGCSRSPQDEPLKQRPAISTTAPGPGGGLTGTAVEPPSGQRRDQPASRPASTLPASSYDPNPPYTVRLNVSSPDDDQPGWLRILQIDEGRPAASATGVFPEQNLIEVDTQNVRRIRVHVAHLPLSAHRRIVLRIDGQGMELSRRHEFLQLERLKTGEWTVLRQVDRSAD